MAFEFDADGNLKQQASPGAFVFDEPAPEPKSRGIVDYAKDTAIDAAQGVVGFGEAAVGLGDIATFGLVGKGLEAIGYDPKQTSTFLSGMQSEARQKSESEVANADGFFGTIKALGTHPDVLIGQIVQALPGTIGAGAVAGALVKRLAATAAVEATSAGLTGAKAAEFITQRVKDATFKIAATAAGAEGAQTAGSIAEAGRQSGREWDQYVVPAIAAGLGTAAIGMVSGKVGQKLGIGDIETDVAVRSAGVKGAGTGAGSWAGRVGKEIAKEGALEEMPQSAQEKYFENVATGQPGMDGVAKASAQGLMVGGAMGGAHAAVAGKAPNDIPADKPTPEDILNTKSVDEAIATAQSALAEPAVPESVINAGKQWQALGITDPQADIEQQRTVGIVGQKWQELAAENQRMAEEAGAQASRNTDARIADVGQKWQDLGITTPAEDLASQKTFGEPVVSWFGRRGDGYQSEEDAGQALPGRQKAQPEFDWKIEPMPNGRFRLAGYALENADASPVVDVPGVVAGADGVGSDQPNGGVATGLGANGIVGQTRLDTASSANPVDSVPARMDAAGVQPDAVAPSLPNYSQMTYGELDKAYQDAIAANDAIDIAAVRKHMGDAAADDFSKLSRRQKDKWMEANATEAMDQDSSAFNGINEESIAEHRAAVNDFDTSSPEALGRSIAIKTKGIDEPGFKTSPEYTTIVNALRYAAENGWSENDVMSGMRSRAGEWAGSDAPELFTRLFKSAAAPKQPDPRLTPLSQRNVSPEAQSIDTSATPVAKAAEIEQVAPQVSDQPTASPVAESLAGAKQQLAGAQELSSDAPQQISTDWKGQPWDGKANYGDSVDNKVLPGDIGTGSKKNTPWASRGPAVGHIFRNRSSDTQDVVQVGKDAFVVRPKANAELAMPEVDQRLVPVSQRQQPASELPDAIQPKAPQRLTVGQDFTPLNEGGKVFKHKAEAQKARKSQPHFGIVKSGKGWALREKTEKQLAAEEQAAKRLSRARVGEKGMPESAHGFIMSKGGLAKSAMADTGFDKNPMYGNRYLFGNAGVTLARAAEMLHEAGYISDESERSAAEVIRRSATVAPVYTPEGTERAAEIEADTRYADFLAAEQENPAEPIESAVEMGYNQQDAEIAGYDEATRAEQEAVNALIAQAEALGIDVDTTKEQAYEDTRNGTHQDFLAAARAAITAAIAESQGNRSADDGSASNAGSAEGLTSPTPEQVTAQQERAAEAQRTEDSQRRESDRKAQQDDDRKRIAQASVRAAGTFELGGDAMQNLTGQENIFDAPDDSDKPFVESPRATYTGNYETDLFGEPVPQASGANRASKPEGSGLRGNVQRTGELQDTPTPQGEFNVNTIVGSETTRRLGTDLILSPLDAAQATHYLYKSAVERFDGIVTDKQGKPLGVVGGFKGATDQTNVYPGTLIGEAVRIPGAAYIWFSHNHPTGNSTLSRADENLNRVMSDAFMGSGIEPQGLLAVGGSEYSYVDQNGDVHTPGKIPTPKNSVDVPVIERTQEKDGPSEAISDPTAAIGVARLYYKRSGNGILLLDAQNSISAWIPIGPEMLKPLRGTGALNSLYRSISQANASASILVHGGDLNERLPSHRAGLSIAENIGNALYRANVRVLDAINVNAARPSAAEGGLSLGSGTAPMFSRTQDTTQSGLTLDQFKSGMSEAFGQKVAEKLIEKGVVVPLEDQSKLPEHVVPFLRSGDVVFGFHDPKTDRTYVVLSNLTPEMVKPLALHEVGVHYGFEAMLGDKKYAAVMRRLDVMEKAGQKDVVAAAKSAKENSVNAQQIPQERLAYLVQNNPEMGIVREIIAAIKAFLFREFGIGEKYLTSDDLTALAKAAVMHASRTQDGGSYVPAFAREPSIDRAPVWKSALLDGVNNINAKALTGAMWKDGLKGLVNKGLVKQDEIAWSGLDDWLAMQQGKVPKEAVLQYLQDNGVKVEEVTLGSNTPELEAELTIDDISVEPDGDKGRWYIESPTGIVNAMAASEAEAKEFGVRYFNSHIVERNRSAVRAADDSKYSEYTLPGGENYREVLLTLPEKTSADPARAEYEAWASRNGLRPNATFSEERYKRETGRDAPAPRTMTAMNADKAANYRSSHWDTPNVLAHIRFNERTDSTGAKTLFIEEIQSDWGQAGKKHGFATDDLKIDGKTAEQWQAETQRLFDALPAGLDEPTTEQNRAWQQAAANARTLRDRARSQGLKDGQQVPSAPFVQKTDAWVSLALKRMIRYAVDNGFDKVAFVNGEQSADRYGLSKQVRSIAWTGRGNDTEKRVTITPNSGNDIEFRVLPDGTTASSSGGLAGNEFASKRLDEVVGKDVAERIMGTPYGDMRGNGLKVGGEGMKSFYDKIVPNTLKEVLRKVGGGQVETVSLERAGFKYTVREAGAGRFEVLKDGELEKAYRTWDEAMRDVKMRNERDGGETLSQPGFTITPAMREKASQGLPMFSKKADQTDTPEFLNWFGASKVVDESSNPLRVYHATHHDITTFKATRGAHLGFHFGDAEAANTRIEDTADARIDKAEVARLNTLAEQRYDELSAFKEGLRRKDGEAPMEEIAAALERGEDFLPILDRYRYQPTAQEKAELGRLDAAYRAMLLPINKTGIGSNIMPLYLSIKKPLRMPDVGNWGSAKTVREALPWDSDARTLAKVVEEIQERGYDGIVYANRVENPVMQTDSYIAFNPEQIKSAIGNTGSFSPTNPDIRFSRSLVTGNPLPTSWQAPDATKMDDLIYSMQDKHIDTKRVVKSVRDSIGALADEIDPYLQEELFHGRAAMQTKEFLEKEVRPLLTDMQARGIEISDFEEYLHNRHAERRNVQVAKINPAMQDGGSGIKTQDARAYLAGLTTAQRTAYEALAKKVDAISKNTRDLLVDSGLEKQSTIDAWDQAYGSEYVPLMREEMDNGMGIGQGFSVRGSSSKRAMGSDKPVANIIANIALQREKAITRSEKRKIGEALYGMVLSAPNPDFWIAVDPALQQNPAQITATAMQLISMGMNPADADSIAKEPTQRYVNPVTGLVEERINPAMRSADNVLAVRIDGEDKYVFFNAKDERAMRMAKALKNLDSDQLGVVMGGVAKMTRYFAAVNTQYNPIFGVTNIARDVQTAMLNLQSTALKGHQADVAKHILPALRGIYIDLRNHRQGKPATSSYAQIFEEFQREGGATGFRDMYANAEERADAIRDEIADIGSGKLKQAGKGIMGWLSDYNETMENAVRVAAYKVAKEQGMSNQQAASLAKNLTVNFNRKGQVALQAGALYAFFNASVQGTARIAQTLAENGKLSSTGRNIIAGGLLIGSMQALLLAAAGFDDDEPPDFVRERSLVIPVGGKKYLSIPMPLGFHIIPNLSRIPTEWAMGGFKNTTKRISQLVGVFADGLNPIGSAGVSIQTITPTIIDPLAAIAENKDWTGKPIAKKDIDTLHPTAGHTRAKDTATPWAKIIAYGVNAATGGTDFKPGMASPTPDQIDYLIGQAFGGVGRELGKLAQVGESRLTGEEIPLHKIPLVGRFVGTTEGQAAESSRFYNNLREIGEHKVEIAGLKKNGRGAEITAYIKDNKESTLYPMADAAQRKVSQLNTLKRDLIKKGASPDRIKLIDMQITSTMKLLNDRARALKNNEPALAQ